jgi:hypothetical protein
MNPLNAANQADDDATTARAASADGADLGLAGLGRLRGDEAVMPAHFAEAGGKRLLCRLPPALKLALLYRLARHADPGGRRRTA